MKTRKILPLILLAVASVFLLSSCDALLDSIFSNNSIGAYVSAYIPSYGYFPSSDVVTIYVDGSSAGTAAYTGNDGLYMYWSVTISKVASGSHTVQATYSHPFGTNTGTWPSTVQTVDFSGGSTHSANLSFNF